MTQGYTPDGYRFTAAYDAEDRLKSLEYTDSGDVVHKTEYHYSGDDLLAKIKKYEDEVLVDNVRIVRNNFLPIQERDVLGNNVIREYVWGINMGGGIGGLLNLKEGGEDYAYLYDGKGNVSALLDETQSVVETYTYDTYGNLMPSSGSFDQPFRFSTKRYDESLGMSYYGYRFYSPSIGRWINRDPLGEIGGINLYGFVKNNPVNLIDPFGLLMDPITSGLIETALIAGAITFSGPLGWSFTAAAIFYGIYQRTAWVDLAKEISSKSPAGQHVKNIEKAAKQCETQ
ncbi:MAG: RHS repeat-associated core domain-containing protein [Candidatus Scalindua sp. AMX11]|nr:MAG: RHS repeat-associated core domain-containing protein [Candidatus Scalindua sp.]NOG85845.1 RHS repeat-associated core domain-containing protein [Planctomycetota bacterium]RZV96983.1 MAG: RHS repeat-associated core domain-containing protein [Candidatus Scalindua sp. SCAELEC01]TDE66405.1 MAG: RHS repeat-associated core domain-containing protein [Candidatus Scalindua sp. AMX11]GJQ58204.1 MAG: hypothetical protein SCALA701_10050 [Candidatus Scalindua sp.]